eukprot:TRINITY_DN18790_c0_g1_i2.p1 TRINITY_DN18790_c0_g1~~TRINITY_DN18790_c0_g1_i2.p1  ORF type:complete len:395 (+),score=38.48 TRINITY_DN18790_c0_g1_i2:112-1296(+)
MKLGAEPEDVGVKGRLMGVFGLKKKSNASSTSKEGPSTPLGIDGNKVGGFLRRAETGGATSPDIDCDRLEEYLRSGETIELGESTSCGLRGMCWTGISPSLRPECWKLLSGLLPTSADRRTAELSRKRQEYHDYISQYYDKRSDTKWMASSLKIIANDIPRTAPDIPFFQQDAMQTCLERILVIWSFRHPASGYVQGMNDLLLPFFYVFASEVYSPESLLSSDDWPGVSECVELRNIEADTYWCFSRFLDSIQDHFTDHQPGIQSKLLKLEKLISLVDPPLYQTLQQQDLLTIQYAFRWLNCLLVREFPLPSLVRIWDTLISEGDNFPEILPYLCVALIEIWSPSLVNMDFAELVSFLQRLPTQQLDNRDIGELISRAYQLQLLYNDSHLSDIG